MVEERGEKEGEEEGRRWMGTGGEGGGKWMAERVGGAGEKAERRKKKMRKGGHVCWTGEEGRIGRGRGE